MITSLPALDMVTERLATRVLRDVSKDKQTYRGKKPVVEVSHHAARPSAATAAIANKPFLALKLNMMDPCESGGWGRQNVAP